MFVLGVRAGPKCHDFSSSSGKRQLAGTVPKQGERRDNSGARLSTTPARGKEIGLAREDQARCLQPRAAMVTVPQLALRVLAQNSCLAAGQPHPATSGANRGVADRQGGSTTHTARCELTKYRHPRSGSDGIARTSKLRARHAHRGGEHCARRQHRKSARSPCALAAYRSRPAFLERKDRSRRSTPAGILLERILFRICARVAGSQSKGEVTNAVGRNEARLHNVPKPTICVSHVVTGHFHLGTMRCPRFQLLVPVSGSNQWFQALGG